MKINLRTALFLFGVSLILFSHEALAHTDVTAEQARELIDSTDDLTVVDVREPSEYCDTRGHIPGALNYPLNSGVLEARYEELPIDGPILVVCRSGGRSNRAATFLDSKDFSMVYDMQGGMSAWIWETEPCIDPDSKYGGGSGESDDPYIILTAEHLNAVADANDWGKHFKLMSNIDLSGYLYDRAVIAPDFYPGDQDFQGIFFSGVFNGNDHKISHLTIKGEHYLGLFGGLGSGAEIFNLNLEAVDVNGTGKYIGALAGSNFGSITTSYSTGTISGLRYVGGLVGNSLGAVVDCSSTGAVYGNEDAGGLVGKNGSGGSIFNCSSAGPVGGEEEIGGLVGENEGNIANCYSSAEVIAYENEIGGLVGKNEAGSVVASFSSGVVTGIDDVGGLVGNNIYGSLVTNCYSIGAVNGRRNIGGLIGSNGDDSDLETSNIINCYSTGSVSGEDGVGGFLGHHVAGNVVQSLWDIETSGQVISAAGIGKTTVEMQMVSTFLDAGWDFVDENTNGAEDIWSICEAANYPRFVWQIPVGDFVCPDGITIDDFAFFMEHWLDDNCELSNGYCQGTDIDLSGTVDVFDLEIFFEIWPDEE